MPTTREAHVACTRGEWTSGQYFPNVIKTLKENKIRSMIDIGANVGEVVNIMLENIESLNELYLFEPHLENMKFLKENIKNNTNGKNIEYCLCGVYYGKKSSKIYQDPRHRNVGGFMIEHAIDDVKNNTSRPLVDSIGLEKYEQIGHAVELKTLEELGIDEIDFIKIDVEASEYNIIENSDLIKKSKFIEIEFHMCSDVLGYIEKNIPTHELIDHLGGNVFLKIKK